jgi:alpha-beta hydrolase superfamily lysophospholipase
MTVKTSGQWSRCMAMGLLALLHIGVARAQAQAINGVFVRIAPRVAGVRYAPPPPAAHADVAIVVMHDNNDFLDHPSTGALSARGFTVIAANPRYAPDLDDRDIDWDSALADLGSTVRYARSMPGIAKVVILGHSSGAALAAAYQNIAENGVSACQGAEKIVPCPGTLAGLPKADGVVLLDPILGIAANLLTSVDPALAAGVNARDFDLLDPANGFAPQGAHYSAEFRRRFLAVEARRNATLVDQALARLAAIRRGEAAFVEDEPFVVPGATRTPRLWRPDLQLLSHTKSPHLLLRGDGSRVEGVVHSVRVPSGLSRAVADRNDRQAEQPASAAARPQQIAASVKPLLTGGSLDTSVKRFLNTFATRATPDYDIRPDDVTGIDWNSSYNSVPGSLEGVKAPLLILGMTGHYWVVSSEIAYRHAASADKSLAYVEGANHNFTPCQPCETSPGQFGDTTARTFEYVAGWLAARF